jgi:hypothetical protein
MCSTSQLTSIAVNQAVEYILGQPDGRHLYSHTPKADDANIAQHTKRNVRGLVVIDGGDVSSGPKKRIAYCILMVHIRLSHSGLSQCVYYDRAWKIKYQMLPTLDSPPCTHFDVKCDTSFCDAANPKRESHSPWEQTSKKDLEASTNDR